MIRWGKKSAETYSLLAQQDLVLSYPEPFMVAVRGLTDRRVLVHHERPLFPSSKRAKVELRDCAGLAITVLMAPLTSRTREIHEERRSRPPDCPCCLHG
jgi:hypothetical protein